MLLFGIVFFSLVFGHYFFFVIFQQDRNVNAKFGCINKSGKIVIEPTFERIYPFFQGLAAIWDDGKMGYIDKSGRVVITPLYEHAFPFYEGLAAVCIDKKWGYINPKGQMVVPACFTDADDFREGLASVKIDGFYGCIDKSGEYIIKPKYHQSFYFSEGLALMKMDTCKYGYLDKSGNIAIEARFDDARIFSGGVAGVMINGKWGFIDNTGMMIIEPQFGKVLRPFNCGIAIVVLRNQICAIDSIGNILWELGDYKLTSWTPWFEDDLAVMWDGKGKYTYIDTNGKTIMEIPGATSAGSFSEGLAAIEVNGLWGYINKTGEFVIEPMFLFAEQFHEGLASVKLQ